MKSGGSSVWDDAVAERDELRRLIILLLCEDDMAIEGFA